MTTQPRRCQVPASYSLKKAIWILYDTIWSSLTTIWPALADPWKCILHCVWHPACLSRSCAAQLCITAICVTTGLFPDSAWHALMSEFGASSRFYNLAMSPTCTSKLPLQLDSFGNEHFRDIICTAIHLADTSCTRHTAFICHDAMQRFSKSENFIARNESQTCYATYGLPAEGNLQCTLLHSALRNNHVVIHLCSEATEHNENMHQHALLSTLCSRKQTSHKALMHPAMLCSAWLLSVLHAGVCMLLFLNST